MENTNGESLSTDEVRIIKGAIDMKEKTVGECQTPADQVFAMSIDTKLDREALQKVWHFVYLTLADTFVDCGCWPLPYTSLPHLKRPLHRNDLDQRLDFVRSR